MSQTNSTSSESERLWHEVRGNNHGNDKAKKSPPPTRELGSSANKRLRDQGQLPGVIYGHKEAVVPIKLNRKEVVRHLDHGTHLFELVARRRESKTC